jgi:3D (Asp-Asp-Asp) domain-containing protein
MIALTVINTKIVQVVDGGTSRYVYTFRTTPAAILRQCGITLLPEDQVDFSGFKNNFAKINLFEAFPVKVSADKNTESVLIAKGTVADTLKKVGVTLGNYDEVNLPLDLTVSPGTSIVVKRVEYRMVTTNQQLNFLVTQLTTTLLQRNALKILTAGKTGLSQTTIKQKYVDGVLTDQQVLGQKVISQPVTCTELVGTAAKTPVSQLEPPPGSLTLKADGTPANYSRLITGPATGYSSPPAGARTSNGPRVRVGYVAVDPRIIPYGSKLYIMAQNGSMVYGYAVAEDTGQFTHDGSGVAVDLFFGSHEEACLFGKRMVNIYVLS